MASPAAVPLKDVIERLAREAWPILEGPVIRTGATQRIRSIMPSVRNSFR
jgi:hypothetical protein